MHLADHTRLIPRVFQQRRTGLYERQIRKVVEAVRVAVMPVRMIVKSAVNHGTAGAARRGRAVGVGESYAFRGQTVQSTFPAAPARMNRQPMLSTYCCPA